MLWLAGPGASASRPMPDEGARPGRMNPTVLQVDDIDGAVASPAAAERRSPRNRHWSASQADLARTRTQVVEVFQLARG